ncbi:MAG: efflux transporter outer membrane subunit [Deltaproteobacteria bacterium]|nr:MAG: efflux transporter outer membrane subunit [Deltaproteobacteria bacterium]
MGRPALQILTTVLLALLLAGCVTVGPDYLPPEISPPDKWNADLKDGLSSESADPQTLASWWTTLDDPTLTNLIERAIEGNLDLKEARARVREARARRGITETDRFPTIDATGSARYSRSSEDTGSGETREFYAVGFDASWELDLFGGVRRSIESAQADLEASEEDLGDVLVSLLAEVAVNYVEARTLQTRLAVAEANLKAQADTYELTVFRSEAGLTTALDVEQAKYNLEDTRSKIPTLRSSLEEAKNRLAVLLGTRPGAVHSEMSEPKSIPVTPLEIAVGVPADVLRRRPDVRRAERELAAQTAQIGVATAELYPKLALFGSIGLEALSIGNLSSAGSRTYGIGPSFSWNIFDAGAIRKNIEVQNALQEQTLIQYEATILTALEDVQNALVAYAEEQLRRQSLMIATKAAQLAVDLAVYQYSSGVIDFRDVLDAQRSLLSFQDQLAGSDGTVTSNLIRLYKALGGGWTSLAHAPGEQDAEQ